ncbi:uncharacterized protein OCT59_000460 [Rhizophagus irregularis]|uniref:RNase III domain-containing protein n=3 Tax=Rhizophagus irregularis TaxID=588596 RepID=U9UTM6_RHIID|nr:hypothetical protein GLOIN_2v1470078 [Rhizophagus irregularis DAOM 181602=DAOM 197198]UZN99180.1 hypothetical protein OCT59_000460 [Rhizophagus irregularis]POG82450.1 hypothetical protein GLOIN_2v1470078 [Rhizophagus irregularis DAOM 181602=DAOM 197198]CAB4396228.1 unnamed protein product [Rhizophagus irregularis]CAB4485298.1 unnamed protein product [Rhizophagus irregularis]CAB5181277.1 unnamed protein product [Rhizophagus irregularis]|eukprot:XP_025189316.1 hypothetical protein GLOIN_2v1470078 [Rhizophagus irregularis DAOM 181602=DAOM 197198]
MSTVRKPEQIIIIDDDAGTESNAQKSNSNSNVCKENLSHLTRTFTTMLGTLYGMSSDDINKMMNSEKGLMTEFHNTIETLSEIFKDSSNKEIPKTLQNNNNMDIINTSHNLETPLNVSLNNASSKEISVSSINNVPLNMLRDESSTVNGISANPQVTLIKNELPINFHQDNNLTGSSINEKGKSTQLSEVSRIENPSSGIKIGDNWELPIIVLDSDDEDDDATIIEIDSDEEEIQELKKMMSLDDIDCIEIGKDEFEKARKAKGETTEDTDDEIFIPIVPDDGSISRKRRRKIKPTKIGEVEQKSSRRKIAEDDEIFDDPSVWRKDLLPFPYITNHVLRAWATGFLHYRSEWERLEYLGDKVLMFCVLRFATAKYLRFYTPSDIKVVTTFLVSNKLLAAYSLTLGLDKKNHMQGHVINKKIADAFEAYIGAYYLSDGEEATTRYLEQLMSPLFELVLSNIQTGRNPHKIMKVISNYFHMTFLTRIPKLK